MYEIEHKYLITKNDEMYEALLHLAVDREEMQQGYVIDDSEKGILRVRIVNEKQAFLTYKKSTEERGKNIEVETEIPVEDAELLMQSCERKINKTRYSIPFKQNFWEVDVFHGRLKGLILAEIEMVTVTHRYDKPSWLWKDVTDDEVFSNYYLSKCSFDDLHHFFDGEN